MIWALALLAAGAMAQADCDVSSLPSRRKRRKECKARAACNWSVGQETCSESDSCASLTSGKCGKRNNCFLDFNDSNKCKDYNPAVEHNCAELGGKKNAAKCNAQPKCVISGGKGKNKPCLTIPDDLDSQSCSNFSGAANKFLCNRHANCDFLKDGNTCVDAVVDGACSGETNERNCGLNKNGCSWDGSNCNAQTCAEITFAAHGRFARNKCESSSQNCKWYSGHHKSEFDRTGNKADDRATQAGDRKDKDGTCADGGVTACGDIVTQAKCNSHGSLTCFWNERSTHMGKDMCQTVPPCDTHTRSGQSVCELGDSIKGSGAKCVWQMSGDQMACMEYACDDADLDTKNKCNKIGCHWHRGKVKNTKNPYCGVFDLSQGRRLRL